MTIINPIVRAAAVVDLESARLFVTHVRAVLGDAPYDARGKIRGRTWRLQNRGTDAPMGLFGGGWQRQLGVQLGRGGWSGTIIVNLWKSSVRIEPRHTPTRRATR